MHRSRRIPLALAAACYLLALVQRPGTVYADTKVDLYVDPGAFLGEVASAWSSSLQLGHVFGGQYGGYLFPMAPWFAAGDWLGLPTWLVHRLWLGTVLAFAAWGVVRLLDELLDRARGAPHVAAAVVFVLNPYVAVYANRTSITLLAYAALPWLLLAVHRGLRDPRGWRWPAVFALVLTCSGGGVNVAVTGWVLLGPVLFVLYERVFGGVGPGALRPLLVRVVPLVLLANAWWLAPAFVHLRYGLDFLAFTEQPGTIWQTTSITESLRLMGFWTSYIGFGYGGELRPFASHGPALVFQPVVLVASLLVPALAVGGFAWSRRWRYGPWFLLLALAGLLVMATGFPEGTPLRKAFTFTYNHVESLRFLRTTYKAGPLLALGLAGLAGGLVAVAWDRLRGRAWHAALAAAGIGLCALAAWPLTSGTAPERQLAFDVPSWWQDAARDVDAMPAGERAMVLPGRLFGYYDWGGTIDPILPTLTERPVAERMIVPYADLRAVDLQFATDALVSQERAVPGQLAPLLSLMGVGRVIAPADDDRSRSGGPGEVEGADVLAGQAGLGAPRAYGPVQVEEPAAGRVRAGARLPRVTVRGAPGERGLVRVLPRGPLTVVDGGAEGVAALAGFGGLRSSAPLAYAADLDAEQVGRASAAGGEVVITDTNRRQAFVAARLQANRGRVLTAAQELSEDGAMLDPFGAGPDAQTVAELRGVADVWAPFSPQTPQYPENRPFAAVDGDPQTAWLADRALQPDRHWVDVRFAAPRDVGTVEVLPYSDERGVTNEIEVAGRRLRLDRPGWVRVPVNRRLAALRVRVIDASDPVGATGGAGGIAEIRVPGVRAGEALRPPVLAERALAGRPVNGRLTYLFARMTTDAPGRTGRPAGPKQTFLLRDRTDPERVLRRTIAPPVARTWSADAWTRVGDRADDRVVDRLAGTTGTATAWGSGREGGLPRFRASRALDGDRGTAWVAPWVDTGRTGGRPRAALTVELDRPAAVRRLRLVPPREVVRRPTRVRVTVRGGGEATVGVGAGGVVTLPRTLRGRRVAIEVLAARFPAGASGVERRRRAVGVAELEGLAGARVRDAGGEVRGRCGDARIRTAAGAVDLRPAGSVADLEAGTALRALACREVALPARRQDVRGEQRALDVDALQLTSAGTGETASDAAAQAGRVLDPGDDANGARRGVRVDVTQPAWLVLGEGYNVGWRATCDGRDLGAPTPLQGFANAWHVEPGCRAVDFAWAPNGMLPPAYALSLLTCLALAAFLLAARRRRRTVRTPHAPMPDDEPARRWAPGPAVAAGVAAGLVLAFLFALRAGVVLGPAVALLLWRGVPARRLALAGGALLAVVVPILYLVLPVDDAGGYGTNVAVERIAAHWVGVGSVFLVGMALWRVLWRARRVAR